MELEHALSAATDVAMWIVRRTGADHTHEFQ